MNQPNRQNTQVLMYPILKQLYNVALQLIINRVTEVRSDSERPTNNQSTAAFVGMKLIFESLDFKNKMPFTEILYIHCSAQHF